MAVPAESTLDPVASHRLVTGHHVFHVSGQQVAVMGKPVGEGRAVIEHVFILRWALIDRSLEHFGAGPPLERSVLDGRKIGPRGNVWIRRSMVRVVGRCRHFGWCPVSLRSIFEATGSNRGVSGVSQVRRSWQHSYFDVVVC